MERLLSSLRHCWVICIALVLCISAVISSPAQTLTTLASFNGANGAYPYFLMTLVQGNDGNFYGTTYAGGASNAGTVFKITPAGTLTTLYSFCAQSDCTDGAYPFGGLVQGTDGNFYGTTYEGGANDAGTLFKITPAGTLTTLYSFCAQSGCTDGEFPIDKLVQGTDGNFYGTTYAGGTNSVGTVFQFIPNQSGNGGTLNTLYSFCSQSGCTDGELPLAGLVQASDGNFYGTTYEGGGTNNAGTVFKITPTGTLTPLYSFCSLTDCSDGEAPYAGLVQASDGDLYGTTSEGGANAGGTLFKITPTGTLTPLYSFCSQTGCTDGEFPVSRVVQATDGNFYGTTVVGGITDAGTVFQFILNQQGNGGTLNSLYSFCSQSGCPDGEEPFGGVVQATNGTFYGTTYAGGSSGEGTVFSLSLTTNNNYTLTVSTSGSGTVTSSDGFINCPGTCSHTYAAGTPVTLSANPASGYTFAGWGGACSGTGSCNVTMTQNLLVTATFSQVSYFLTVATTGRGTVTSTDGNINCPGVCGYGYPVDAPVTLNATPAQGWTFAGWGGACSGNGPCNLTMTQNLSVTATFTQNANNFTLTVAISGAGTVMSTDGNINCPGTCSFTYPNNTQVTLNATATQGGTFTGWSGPCSGTGSCMVTVTQNNTSVTASFSLPQQEMLMHSFGGNGGQTPLGSLISDSSGNFYGTTSMAGMNGKGTVFEVSATGTETVLHSFGSGSDGQNPEGNLVFDSAGNLYGTTSAGGTNGTGTVFELSPNGTETVLYSFGSGADGQNPYSGLIFDGSGNFYGTTVNGGTFGGGTAFELSPNGAGGWTETVLYSFGNGSSDGKNPYSALVFDSSGNLYGTTNNGGASGFGTVFELLPSASPNRCCREMPIYSFGSGSDGANPFAGLTFDTSGNLYGTTNGGGTNGMGTAFELSPDGSGGYSETVLYAFGNGSSDGQSPYGGLVLDNSGNLYGTTQNGGLYSGGTVFELVPNALSNRCCREIQVYSFGNGMDGKNPHGGLIFTPSGNLYGTTANGGSQGAGTTFAIMPGLSPVQFVTATPCRVVDTRQANGTFGGPAISGNTTRSFPLAQSGNPCNIPSNVIAYSLNVTVVPEHPLGYLTIWPTGQAQPTVSTLNSPDGRVKANAAIVPAGTPAGSVSVYVTDTTNVILDIDGYFTSPGSQTLQFYPLTPCRVVDTRGDLNLPQGLGPPSFGTGEMRKLPIPSSACFQGLPNTPVAYSFNVTVAPSPPGQTLNYLTIWPSDQQQPYVSTLNNPTATVVANAAIVPAATTSGEVGDVRVYTYNSTDVIIDTNGYFAAAESGGYSFYPVAPCRAYDSRNNNGQPFTSERTVPIAASPCAPPGNAAAYVFNATVVPSGSLGYLTLWADGETQPVVSTLNAYDGFITSNLAIVPNMDGSTDAFAAPGYPPGPGSGYTQLILDISGYFAP